MKKGTKIVLWCLLVVFILIGIGLVGYKLLSDDNDSTDNTVLDGKEKPVQTRPASETDFNMGIIKSVNSSYDKGNYLISPYSIEVAVNMLKVGAKGNTLKEIEYAVGTRDIPTFNVKDRISVANAVFIKDEYKDKVLDSFYKGIDKYKAELVYDKFVTPDKINEWVNKNTYGMIPSILNDISPDFVLGLANAVAIDVKWETSFECINTREADFTKDDGTKMKTEMMFNSLDGGNAKYFKTDDATGVILPYQSYASNGEYSENGTQLEFVGILPNGNVKDYVENLSMDKIKAIDSKLEGTDKHRINVYLPRFAHSFDLKDFDEVLKGNFIVEAFDPNLADFSGILGSKDLYVSEAIHKTYIDLNEEGTKAAAVTYFGMDKNAMPMEKETVTVEFNKPFVYMIRDSKTKEILFFGVLREPNTWKGPTCSEK